MGWVADADLVGFLGNEAVYRIRVGRRIGSAALIADGLTLLAVLAGAGGVAAGWPLVDRSFGLVQYSKGRERPLVRAPTLV